MTSWTTTPIQKLGLVVTGSTPKSMEADSWGDEVAFITPSDQQDGAREVATARALSSLGAQRMRRRVVPPGSTCFTCIGATIGKTSLTSRTAVTNQQINTVVPHEGTDGRFLYYALTYNAPLIAQIASGSATPIINKTQFQEFRIKAPELPAQKAIGQVLGALDDKIAVNDRIRRASDELRGLKLRYWARSHSGSTEVSPLSSFGAFVNGRAFTKDATGTGRMVIRIAEINSGPGGSTIYNNIDAPDEHLARPGDVLFAWSGSLAVTRWYRPEAIINQHIFKVIPNIGVPAWLAYELVSEKLVDFKAVAAGKATTMGHIQRHHLDEPVLAPKPEQMNMLDAELGPLWDRALAAEQESLTLAELRDTLLPKLMSGEIRVRDAERVVEDAT